MTKHELHLRSPDTIDIKKRNFIKGLMLAIVGFMTISITLPFIGYLIPESTEGGGNKFIKVPNFPAIPVGTPTKMTFEAVDVQAFIKSNIIYDIWVVKHATDKATVFSPLCTHLNCRYDWIKGKHEFICPCHGSIFSETGEVLGGPAPRPLDTLPHKIEGGQLYVKWEYFRAAIPQKIEV